MTVFSIFAANMIVVTIARADTSYKLITASASQEELCHVNTNDIDIHSIDWNGYQSVNKKTTTNNDNNKTKFSIGIDGSYDEYDEHIDDIDQDDMNNRINTILGSSSASKLSMVGDRKFEIPELCEMFLGIRGRDAYMVTIVLYLYGTCKHYHYHHNHRHYHHYHHYHYHHY
jgi:hypothetical protein